MSPPRRDEARLVREFVAEAEEILERAAETLSRLEEAGDDAPPEVVNAFFRSIHSLKGLAGMVGLAGVADASHAFEALLDAVRMGRAPLDALTLAASRESVAALGDLVRRLAAGEPDPASGPELSARLAEACAERPSRAVAEAPPLALPPEIERVLTDYERHRLTENRRKGREILAVTLELPLETFDEGLRRGMTEAGNGGELIGTLPGPPVGAESMSFVLLVGVPPAADPEDFRVRCGARSAERLSGTGAVSAGAARPGPAERAADPEPETPAPGLDPRAPETSLAPVGGTVRVPVEKLAHLLDLTGDLALARSALRHAVDKAARGTADRGLKHELAKTFDALDRAISGLSRAALATRLVPVDQVAARLSRAVRSIASSLGKDVELEVVGGETELDKLLADELSDPLLHIVRNAVGHGIETPDERRAAGKSASGHVRLEAETRGRDVAITISDDGRGIDADAVVLRARERGLLGPDAAPPADPLDLLFLPGFSTAEEVSELSGRGVGLDVVRSRIAALEGVVLVRTEKGAGTSFEVVLPITLAIVESLLVRDGASFFAFPSSSVARTLSLDAVSPGERAALPMARLSRLLGIERAEADAGGKGGPERPVVVVAERGARRAGFVVSSIEGLLDLVVKPLPETIARSAEITGAAELPDGELALTLDAGLLVERVLLGGSVS